MSKWFWEGGVSIFFKGTYAFAVIKVLWKPLGGMPGGAWDFTFLWIPRENFRTFFETRVKKVKKRRTQFLGTDNFVRSKDKKRGRKTKTCTLPRYVHYGKHSKSISIGYDRFSRPLSTPATTITVPSFGGDTEVFWMEQCEIAAVRINTIPIVNKDGYIGRFISRFLLLTGTVCEWLGRFQLLLFLALLICGLGLPQNIHHLEEMW